MPFAVTGTAPNFVITHTGTDTSLAGLNGLSGVATENLGFYTKNRLSNTTRLIINGNLSFNTAEVFEQLAFNFVSRSSPGITIGSSGSLTIGTNQSELLQRYAGQIPAIVEEWLNAYELNAFQISGGFFCYGQSVVVAGQIQSLSASTTVLRDTRMTCGVLRMNGPTLTIDGLDLWTRANNNASSFVVTSPSHIISGMISRSESYVNLSASTPAGTYSFSDIPSLPAGRRLVEAGSFSVGVVVNFFNLASGSDYLFDFTSFGSRFYTANLFKRVSVVARNQLGVAVENALIWIRGRSGTTVYSATTNSSGTHSPVAVQISQHVRSGTTGTNTYYSISDSVSDDFLVRIVLYGFTIGSLPNQILKGLGDLTTPWTLFSDSAIVSTKSEIDAKTVYTTTNDLYDTSQAWKADNFTLLYPSLDGLLCSADGAALDFGSLNVILDPTAVQARTVNTATNTITFKTSTVLTGTFTAIRTDGTIELRNGATQGLITLIDSTGTRSPIPVFSAPNINVGTNGENFNRVSCRISRYFSYSGITGNSSTNVLNISGNAMPNDTAIMLTGEDLPQPLDERAFYYVVNSTGSTIQVSNTPGGAAIDLTDPGSGVISLWGTFEIDNRIVTSGGYSQDITSVPVGGQVLFQAMHLSDSSVGTSPAVASKYFEQILQRDGLTVSTLERLEADVPHNAFCQASGIDGYSIRAAEFEIDPATPSRVTIRIDDPDAQTSTDRAYQFYVYVQHTAIGMRLFRGYLVAENVNSIKVYGALTVLNPNESTRLTITGPQLARADGKTWVDPESKTIIQTTVDPVGLIVPTTIPYDFPIAQASQLAAVLAYVQNLAVSSQKPTIQ